MNDLSLGSAEMMSSREIAKLTGKQHAKVFIIVADMTLRGVAKSARLFHYEHEQNGQKYKEYFVDKRDSLIIVARLSPEFLAAVVDRWQELENQQHQIPQTFSEALLLAANQAEKIEEQAQKIALDAPKVAYMEKYLNSDGLRGLTEAAKSLGFKPRQFTEALKADKFLYYTSNSLVPIQKWLDKKFFKIVEGESHGHNYNQTKITSLGMNYFAQRYASELGE